MKQYLDIMADILENGIWKDPARPGMPRTKELFCRSMRFDLSKGFPLVTTKKMFTRGIVSELLWFLQGKTNIYPLIKQGNHIWDADAYKYYRRRGGTLSKEIWLTKVLAQDMEVINGQPTGNLYGECGDIYGKQWVNYGYGTSRVDQIAHLLDSLKNRPNERYHIINAWDPNSYIDPRFNRAALPACHVFYQFCVRDGKLDMMMLQRSCDFMLGVPFDLAMCGILCNLVALAVGLEPGEFVWVGNSCHIYENHIGPVKEQLTREPLPLCHIEINKKNSLTEYTPEDIKFIDYKCHPAIKAELSVGI